MAWRKLTLQDLAAHISQEEIDAFRQYGDFGSGVDPIADLLVSVAAECRMKMRKNFFVKLSPDPSELPPELISPACDIVAFKMLKRLPQEPLEARKLAYQSALDLLKEIQNDEIRPESYVDPDAEDAGAEEEDMRNIPVYILNVRPNLLR